jgi:hypothetical protein
MPDWYYMVFYCLFLLIVQLKWEKVTWHDPYANDSRGSYARSMYLSSVCKHRHSNSGPPFFLIWSLPRLWYGSLSGSISLNHLSIFYNISCYNSLVLLTFVSRPSCRITYIYIKVWNNRQNTKRKSSLRLDILQ